MHSDVASSQAPAWILTVSGERRVALGQYEMIHILPQAARLFVVPCAPAHCDRMMLWEGQVLPVMDLACLLAGHGDTAAAARAPGDYIAVVAWQTGDGQAPAFGALRMSALPERASVGDGQSCPLPAALCALSGILCSCFEHPRHGPVPVLDLPGLFGVSSAIAGERSAAG